LQGNGNPVPGQAFDFAIAGQAFDDSQPDVAPLAGSGFVTTWTRDFGAGDHDIVAQVCNQDGSLRTSFVAVNDAPDNASHASVAGLNNGNFVVAWHEQPAAGGDSAVYFRLFDHNGVALDGTDQSGVLIDSFGSINRNIDVAALHDGGFVVAYEDSGWTANGTAITVRIFNADGTARSDFLRVNAYVNPTEQAPKPAVLSNGDFVVGLMDGTAQTI
jgi:hypothetical protein